jgi:BolA protein
MRPSEAEIAQRLKNAFPHAHILVQDDSDAHLGHAGAQHGAGHYTVDLICATFVGLTRLARHRLVYDALRHWMPDRIHALRIKARAPDETASP